MGPWPSNSCAGAGGDVAAHSVSTNQSVARRHIVAGAYRTRALVARTRQWCWVTCNQFGINAASPAARRDGFETNGARNTDNRSPTIVLHEFKASVDGGARPSVFQICFETL